MTGHGYVRYTHGCRCRTCKDAKAAYVSRQRKQATASARPGVAVNGVKHGTRVAYKDHGCRCGQCTDAMRRIWRGWDEARRQRARAGGEAA